ncbi:MAG: GNAT family N-acetyltransferase [Proteobacteria bacterium]|nr:GNAT family N-acetyltransferase [Pseudomonadota bacterium]
MMVERASASDLQAIRTLLAEAGLPVDDLGTADVSFWVTRDALGILGAIGVERFGTSGLLRSLVVAPRGQERGVASALLLELESSVRSSGLEFLALLTQTAAPFFAKRGYVVTPREQVPVRVRQSSEFATLCPASAVCMSKAL